MIEKQPLDVLFLSSLFNTCKNFLKTDKGKIGIEKMVP